MNSNNTLNAYPTLILATLKQSENILSEAFSFQQNDFSSFSLPVHNCEELFSLIDPENEMVQALGIEHYHKQLNEVMSRLNEKGGEVTSFLPLSYQGRRMSWIVYAKREEQEEIIHFLFLKAQSSKDYPSFNVFLSATYKDKLTSLFSYDTLLSHLKGNKENGYLCLFDLNRFKPINDLYGHHTGDDVLSILASFLISISTKKEIYYRRSGDEFMILFLKDDYDYVLHTITRIDHYLRQLKETTFSHLPAFDLSAAFGVVQIRAKGSKISHEQEIQLADLAMYQAKYSHKLYHYINYDDSLSIVKNNDLEERLEQASRRCSRQ